MAGSSRRRQQQEKQQQKGKEKTEVHGSSHGQQQEKEKVTGRRVSRRQQEEKESMAAAMAATEEKEKGKEKEGEKFGQQFFSMFSPQQHGERLRIPPLFHQYLGNEPIGVVSLEAQSGNTWAVELASDTQGLFFRNGWKEFVEDHSLETGDVLTFRYVRRSKFSVVVFDGKCSEKPSAFHAKPCKDVEEDMDMNTNDLPEIPDSPSEESNESARRRSREIYFFF